MKRETLLRLNKTIESKKLFNKCYNLLKSLNKKALTFVIILIMSICIDVSSIKMSSNKTDINNTNYNETKVVEAYNYLNDVEVYQLISSKFEWSTISNETLNLIFDVAEKENFDENLLLSIVFAESNFNQNCVSSAGAVGLIQLMPETAKEMGLIVDNNIDERKDPRKNLTAGVRYIKKYDEIIAKELGYQDWKMTLAGYNCGPNRVIREQKIPNIKETQDYVKKIYETWYMLDGLKIYKKF